MYLDIGTVSVLLGFAVFVGVYLYSAWQSKDENKTRGKKPIPGPKLVDTKFGHNAEIKASGNMALYCRKLHALYGPVVGFYLGTTYTVSLGTPAAFNQSRKLFDRPPFMYDMFAPFLGSRSLEVCNGEEARLRHAAYTRFFSFGAISPYYPIIQKRVSEICSLWSSENGPVEVGPELRKYAIVAIEIIVFRGFVPDDKEILDFIDKFEEAFAEIEGFINGDMEHGSEGGMQRTQLIEWGLYLLAKYHDIQERMRQEIQDVLGDEPITADAVKYLVYMRQFIDEVQRWVTIAPFGARINHEDMEVEGYTIPAQTSILQTFDTVHYDEAIYSEPERFDPDRFLPEKRKSLPPHSLEPFGFSGGRRCVGSQVFNTEATVMFTTLIQKLQLSLPQNEDEMHKQLGSFSRPHRNVRVLFKTR